MKKKGIYSLSDKFIVHLISNSIAILILAELLPMNYESNDDTAMLIFSSGVYSGAPDAHLVFINYIYGFLVSSLYKFYSAIEWYTVLFVLIHIVSFSIITWKLTVSKSNNIFKIIFLLIFYLLEIYCISALQFTTTAAICALASLILFVSDNKTYTLVISVCLFLLASLIRFDAAFLILIIFSPLIVCYLIRYLSISKKQIYFLILLISLPVVAKQTDAYVYDLDDDWKAYREYNHYRGMINDNLTVLDAQDLPDNITEADYWLFCNFFPDTKIFNIDVLKEITMKNKEISLADKFYRVVFNILKYKYHVSIIILLAVCFFILLPSKGRIILSSSLVLLTVSFIFMSIVGTLKVRVFIATIFVLCWVLFSLTDLVKIERKLSLYAFFVILFAFISSLSIDISKWHIGLKKINKAFLPAQKTLSDYLIKTSEKEFIVPYQSALRFEIYSPWNISNHAKEYEFKSLGWLSSIPLNQGNLDSYLDIVDEKMILIGKNNYELFIKNIKQSISHHYGIDIQDNITFENELYYLLELTIKNKTDDTI